jgi:hypothetical protein
LEIKVQQHQIPTFRILKNIIFMPKALGMFTLRNNNEAHKQKANVEIFEKHIGLNL